MITHFLIFLNSNWNSFNENWKKTARKDWSLVLLRLNFGFGKYRQSFRLRDCLYFLYPKFYFALLIFAVEVNFCTMTLFICDINTLLALFLKLKHTTKNVALLSVNKTKVWNAMFSILFNKWYHRKLHSPSDFFSKDFRNRSLKATWRNCTIVTLFWLLLLAFIQ